MPEKSTPDKKILEEEDTPAYQEMVLFYLSTGVKTVLIAWCITIISLAYIKLPDSKWWVADQRIDATYAAGILGGLLGSLGVTVANQGKKKEEKNGNGKKVENGSGYQTIIIKQPIELITRKPDVIRVDPISGKNVKNDGSLEP
jgi:hypothetical protein